jgi:hypothetical protein
MLRAVIPKIFNYDELSEQNIISLFEKVGKEVVNNVILKIYNKYKLQSQSYTITSNDLKFSYNIIDDLNFNL